jgi:hypothetical protein
VTDCWPGERGSREADPGHHEGRRPPEQITRNWNELLQELRVVQTGVQILTGFLLTVPFSQRFTDLNDRQHLLYLAVLVGSILTTALIVAPVAFHRVLFRQRQRDWLVAAAHVCARVGLAGLGLVSTAVVLLVFDVVVGLTAGLVAAACVLVAFAALWFAVPMIAGHRNGT